MYIQGNIARLVMDFEIFVYMHCTAGNKIRIALDITNLWDGNNFSSLRHDNVCYSISNCTN